MTLLEDQCSRTVLVTVFNAMTRIAKYQRILRKTHNQLCVGHRRFLSELSPRARRTLRIGGSTLFTPIELWLQMLAVDALDLIAHPERATIHFIRLVWALVLVTSLREYHAQTPPRPRFNVAGERKYMLNLRQVDIYRLDEVRKGDTLERQTDWSNVLEPRPHVNEACLTLEQGEPLPIRVVCSQGVDPEYGGSETTSCVGPMRIQESRGRI